MATKSFLRNDFVEHWIAEGEAKGEVKGQAEMLLRVLSARGLSVPASIQQRVLSCTDVRLLQRWGDRAATAACLDDVFGR